MDFIHFIVRMLSLYQLWIKKKKDFLLLTVIPQNTYIKEA